MTELASKSGESNTSNAVSAEESTARSKIGRQVTYFALGVTGLLGLAAIFVAIFADEKSIDTRFRYVKDILTIILPLIGTWVGTVLAFYFSRENFIAAATHTADLVRQLTPEQKLQSTSVTEVMINIEDTATVKLKLKTSEDGSTIKLKQDIVDNLFEKFKKNRLPIIEDESGKVLYVLHRSFVDKFISNKASDPAVKIVDLTLKDILEVTELRNAFVAFAIVARSAKLIAVKEAMDGNPNCADAFVTEDGSRNSRALGWITDVIVSENARV
jgi:hypothetical protein